MPPRPSISWISNRPPSTCPASRILAVALMARVAAAAIGDLLTPIVGASDILLGSSGFMGLLLNQGHSRAVGRSIHRYLQVNTGISNSMPETSIAAFPGRPCDISCQQHNVHALPG